MKNKLVHITILLLVFSSAALAQEALDKSLALDSIFNSDRIKITIPHHGGYTASKLGNAIMEIRHSLNDSSHHVMYRDAIDKRKLEVNISSKEYLKLKSIFSKLLTIHQDNKSLSGDCFTIDKNYILKTKTLELVIKPDKTSNYFDCLDEWIYALELKN